MKFTRYLYLDIDELFLPRSVAPERQLHISMTSFASQPARTTVLFWVKMYWFPQFRLYKGKVASQARWKRRLVTPVGSEHLPYHVLQL